MSLVKKSGEQGQETEAILFRKYTPWLAVKAMSKFIYTTYIHPPRTALAPRGCKCCIKITFSLHRKSCKQTCCECKAGRPASRQEEAFGGA